jgi:hypothetical protein
LPGLLGRGEVVVVAATTAAAAPTTAAAVGLDANLLRGSVRRRRPPQNTRTVGGGCGGIAVVRVHVLAHAATG